MEENPPLINLIHPYYENIDPKYSELFKQVSAINNGDNSDVVVDQQQEQFWKINLALKGEVKSFLFHKDALKNHSELFGDLIGNDFEFSDVKERSTTIDLLTLQELSVFERIVVPCLYGSRSVSMNRGLDLVVAYNFFDYLQMDGWKQCVKKEMDELYSFKSIRLKSECLDQHTDYFLKVFFLGHPTFVIDTYYVNYHYERFVVGINKFLMEKNRKRCLRLMLGLDVQGFISLFTNEKIGIYSEHQIFKAISWFIESHPEINQEERDSLWKMLKVCNLSDEEFGGEVLKSSLISDALKTEMELNRSMKNKYSNNSSTFNTTSTPGSREYIQSIIYCGSSDGQVQTWDLYKEKLIESVVVHSNLIHDIKTFQRDGTDYIFTCGEDGHVSLSKCSNANHLNLVKVSSKKLQDCPILTMDLNENFLVVNSSTGVIHIFDVSRTSQSDSTPLFKEVQFERRAETAAQVRSVCLFGDYLITGDIYGAVEIWYVGNLTQYWDFKKSHSDAVMYFKRVVIGQKDYLLSASCDRSVILWDISDGRLVMIKKIEISNGFVYALDTMLLSPELSMNYVVTGSTDRQIVISQLDGQQLKILRGHKNYVYDVIVNHLTIFSFADDNTIRVWNTESGECDQTIYTSSSIRCATLPESCNSVLPLSTCPIQ